MTEKKLPKLRPCPFCGSPARAEPFFSGLKVECSNPGPLCGACVSVYTEPESLAINIWNRRHINREMVEKIFMLARYSDSSTVEGTIAELTKESESTKGKKND
jgi:Restriction alleviation protein Lar